MNKVGSRRPKKKTAVDHGLKKICRLIKNTTFTVPKGVRAEIKKHHHSSETRESYFDEKKSSTRKTPQPVVNVCTNADETKNSK